METIVALMERELYRSQDGIWSVAKLRHREKTTLFEADMFTAAGSIPAADRGEVLELTGEWVEDAKYGRQFRVDDAGRVFPDNLPALEKYLVAEVHGVGPAIARKLCHHFGLGIRQILDHFPHRLSEAGIGESTILKITQSWNENKALQPLKIFLASHGLNGKTWATRIDETLGANAIVLIERNPYCLTVITGIGFRKADEMAQKMGWPDSCPERTEAALIYVLEEAKSNGNMYLPQAVLLEKTSVLAGCRLAGSKAKVNAALSLEEVQTALDNTIQRGEIHQEITSLSGSLETLEYLPYLYTSEEKLARTVARMAVVGSKPTDNLTSLIAAAERDLRIDLSDKQQKAVIAALRNSFSIITGGPGVGKSTVTKVILHCMKSLRWRVKLAAPTGRAAKRLNQITGESASTVHRLVGSGEDRHDAFNQFDFDALILDEWSMADTSLNNMVLDAVPHGMHVVVIGDVDQLPSIGPGMVLRDLIECGAIPVTRLDTIFRQAQGSLITQNAHRIIHGEYPEFPAAGTPDADHHVMYVPQVWNEDLGKNSDDIEWVRNMLTTLVTNRIPQRYQVDPLNDIQVLAPMKKGSAGTWELNKVLHEAINPSGSAFDVRGFRWYVGDRVMQTRNDAESQLFNGDIGIILSFDGETESVLIQFEGRPEPNTYLMEKMGDLQVAFASTIHKVQGSEMPIVILVLLGQHFTMLDRNLVYTALTRAKRMCLFITTKKALSMAVKRCEIHKRYSFMAHRVRNMTQSAGKRPALPPRIPVPAELVPLSF